MPNSTSLDKCFSRYIKFEPKLPIWQVTNGSKPSIHRFYDTSPISPSGRFLAFTEFETDEKLPKPGEAARVIVRDLENGDTVLVRTTFAWDTQLGAQVQWGTTDDQLLFNNMSTTEWRPYGELVNPFTGETQRLDDTVYMVSPDGSQALTPCLRRINKAQYGYGVHVPTNFIPDFKGASSADGVRLVDLVSGKAELWLSTEEIVRRLPECFSDTDTQSGQFYIFHVKWSPDAKRIMIILRCRASEQSKGPLKNWLLTVNSDKSDLHVAVGPNLWLGGHHPNWCPDSQNIVMNLVYPFKRGRLHSLMGKIDKAARKVKFPLSPNVSALRLCKFKYDGSDLAPISTRFLGSGHPTWHDEREGVLTDAYPHEPVAKGDGTVPLRWIEAGGTRELQLVRIRTASNFSGPNGEWRIDPHPAWDRNKHFFTFNGAPDGVRSVFIADASCLASSNH